MRPFPLAPAALLLCLATVSRPVSAQMAPYQMGDASAVTGAAPAPAGAPAILRRAAALVSMAQSAPAAATSIRASREAHVAATEAAAAYQTALANYYAGFQLAADSAARRAIQLADGAVATVLPRAIVEDVTGGEIFETPAATNPPPVVTTATNGALALPTSYAEVTRLPFGAILAGPGAPPLPDSLPFGAIPVGPNPSPIAP